MYIVNLGGHNPSKYEKRYNTAEEAWKSSLIGPRHRGSFEEFKHHVNLGGVWQMHAIKI
jgi:hypothetical protein